ncbi:MAG: hypothetical protein LBJ61_01490, partial [Deltaproteobacteria bacterium]|nr:hypothetical protein [Deltaproteobacteria bacterium]
MTIANQTDRPAGRRRKSLRDIVEINEQLCDGCGECLPSCAEGALSIENGRVVLKAEALCDGLGACIGRCPKGALTLAKRFTDDFIPLESGQRVLEEEPRDSYGSHGAELDIDLTMARNLAAEVAGPQDRSAARCPVGPK